MRLIPLNENDTCRCTKPGCPDPAGWMTLDSSVRDRPLAVEYVCGLHFLDLVPDLVDCAENAKNDECLDTLEPAPEAPAADAPDQAGQQHAAVTDGQAPVERPCVSCGEMKPVFELHNLQCSDCAAVSRQRREVAKEKARREAAERNLKAAVERANQREKDFWNGNLHGGYRPREHAWMDY